MTIKFAENEVFVSRSTRKDAAEKKWRLSQKHIVDLQDIARGIEEGLAGICCKYLLDQRSGVGADYDETVLDDAENFCQRVNVWGEPEVREWRDRIQRARRALHRMRCRGDNHNVGILHVAYGFPDPAAREFPKKLVDDLQEQVSLVRYTATVENFRLEMARQEGLRRAHQHKRSEYPPSLLYEDAFRHNMNPIYFAPIYDIMHTRDRIEWASKAISSGDALRAMFAPLRERGPNETKDHYMARKTSLEARRDAAIVKITEETSVMLEEAQKAYHAAWLASARD